MGHTEQMSGGPLPDRETGKSGFFKKRRWVRPMETVGQSVHVEDTASRGKRNREVPGTVQSPAGAQVHMWWHQDGSRCWGDTMVNKTKPCSQRRDILKWGDRRKAEPNKTEYVWVLPSMKKRENRVWRMGNGYWRQTDRESLWEEVTLGWVSGRWKGETERTLGRGNSIAKVQRWVWTWHIQGRERSR